MIDEKMLEVLSCPATHSSLIYDEDGGFLISKRAGLAFPIRDGIPIMLVEEAHRLGNN